jgi:cytochrome P450
VADRDFPHASTIEGLRFTAQVAVPNVIQGLFRRRRIATAAADRAGTDGLAAGFMAGLKRNYGDGPLWVRVGAGEALVLLGADAIRHALEGSPDPFAADPEPKKSAMERFQPDALTISRGADWEDRRRFTEAVLDTGKPLHRLADRFAGVCVEEAAGLPEELDWDAWNGCVRRVTRRIVLGEGAADDDQLSTMLGELMDKSNPPGRGDADLFERFSAALGQYVSAGEEASLVGLFAQAPVTDRTKPERQVTHWLFALGDTLAINALRCLALLAAFEDERMRVLEELRDADLLTGAGVASLAYLEACLQEAMRLWPTTAMLSRVCARDASWDGVDVPAGKQLLIVNTFNHRDRDAFPAFADRFAPEQWLPGGAAAGDWTFNHFSNGPQGCPGAGLALFVGKAMLGTVLRERTVVPAGGGGGLRADKPLPASLDYFGLRFGLGAG